MHRQRLEIAEMTGFTSKSARLFALTLLMAIAGWPAGFQARAASVLTEAGQLPGWRVMPTRFTFPELSMRLEAAIAANGMNLVNSASASDGAKAQGITIPGNRVVGVFRNDFARRMLSVSLAAGIEAPIRFYVTESPDGTACLSYRIPTSVFAPYMTDGGDALRAVAAELDAIFNAIARHAVGP